MDRYATIAQLLYWLAVDEKCNVPRWFSRQYRHNLKISISRMDLLVDCLMDNQCSPLPHSLCTYIEQNAGKKFPIQPQVIKSWKDQGFIVEKSEESLEINKLICLMKKILQTVLFELETRKRGYNHRILLLIHDFHNLPRPLMDGEKKTLWPMDEWKISADEAIAHCTLGFDKQAPHSLHG